MAQGDWPEESPRQQRRTWRWWALGLAAAVAFFVLLVAAIQVSTYQVNTGLRVLAQPQWVIGERNALRVMLLELKTSEYLPGLHLSAQLRDRDGVRRIPLGVGESHGTGAVELGPVLPSNLPPGPYVMELQSFRQTSKDGPHLDAERASIPIEVIAKPATSPPFARLRHGCEEGRVRDAKRAWSRSRRCSASYLKEEHTRLFPESGSLVANLDNLVTLWSDPGSAPLSYRLRGPPLAPGQPLPKTDAPFVPLIRDAAGLASITLHPSFPPKGVELKQGTGSNWLWLRDQPTQLLVRPARRMQRADELMQAEVFSVRGDVPLFLDLWIDGRFIGADSVNLDGSKALGYELKLPGQVRGLTALRVSFSPEGPQGSFDEGLLFIDDRAETAQGLRRLVRRLRSLPVATPLGPVEPGETTLGRLPPDPILDRVMAMPPDQLARLDREGLDRVAGVLLSRVELSVPWATLLLDTTEAKKHKLEAWKTRLRRPMIAGLGLLMFLTLGVLGVGLWRARQAMRARLADLDIDDLQAAAGEGEQQDDDLQGPGESLGRISSGGGAGAALLLVGLLIFALVALSTLMETLRWDWGQ